MKPHLREITRDDLVRGFGLVIEANYLADLVFRARTINISGSVTARSVETDLEINVI